MSTTGIIIGILVAAVLLVLVEMYRELHTFRVTRYQVTSPKLAGKKTWVFLSDLHNQVYGENHCRLIDAVKQESPDIILIGGDMLVGKNGHSYEPALACVKELVKIASVYYVNGNHEERMKLKPEKYDQSYALYKKKLLELGVHLLENESTVLYDKADNYSAVQTDGATNPKEDCVVQKNRSTEGKVRLTGLEIPLECYTHLKRRQMPEGAIKERIGERDPEAYQVLLAHNPSYMKDYLAWGADLILSGHLHGGMVRIPGIGGVIGPDFVLFPKYSGEMRRVGRQTVIVSKGLGTHTIHIRLFNPAEIVVLSLNNC